MSFVSAYILYDGNSGTYVGDQGKTIQINCDRMRAYSPRPCYLLRRLMPGDGTQQQVLMTFDASSDELADANTLQGFAIEVDGQDSVIDITTWEALINACNCPDCDTPDGNPVASVYSGAPTAFNPPTLKKYCIDRLDDGSGYAIDKMVTDYVGQYVGNIKHICNTAVEGGYESTYQVQAYKKPSAIGDDVVTLSGSSGTADCTCS